MRPTTRHSTSTSIDSGTYSAFESNEPSVSEVQPRGVFFLPFFSAIDEPYLVTCDKVTYAESHEIVPNYVLPLGHAEASSNVSDNVAPITTTGTAEPRPTKGRVPVKGQM